MEFFGPLSMRSWMIGSCLAIIENISRKLPLLSELSDSSCPEGKSQGGQSGAVFLQHFLSNAYCYKFVYF